MKILVASDLTSRSDRALARAFLLARELKGTLRVLHVVDEEMPGESKAHALQWAKKTLTREIGRLAARTGVSATLEVIAGRPRADIARLADSGATDLLVLGVHDGPGEREKPFAETTAGGIVKSSIAATLLVRSKAAEPYRRVVVGIDFSVYSRAAVHQALALAPEASLRLVHAYRVPFQGFLGSGSVASEIAYDERLELDAFLEDGMDDLEARARALAAVPGTVETVVEEGDPREVLRDVCRRAGADLLVIGTHASAGTSRAAWGSVAADLLEDPPTDVLVVRPF